MSAAADAGRLACGPLSSFLLCRLLEERPILVDPANASRTQLYDPATRDWSPPLLHLFGLSASALPTPVGNRHRFGSLRINGRARLSTDPELCASFVMEGKATCGLCHYYDRKDGSVDPVAIVPPRVPTVWYPHAKFSHRPHRARDERL